MGRCRGSKGLGFFCRGCGKLIALVAVARPLFWLLLSRLPRPTRCAYCRPKKKQEYERVRFKGPCMSLISAHSRPYVSLTLPLGPTSHVGVSSATVVKNRGLFGEAPSTSAGGNPAAGFGTTTTVLQGLLHVVCNMKFARSHARISPG